MLGSKHRNDSRVKWSMNAIESLIRVLNGALSPARLHILLVLIDIMMVRGSFHVSGSAFAT